MPAARAKAAEPESDLFGVKPGQPEPPAADVVEALARVMRDLGGIEKLTPEQRRARGIGSGEQGISYAYRGIDQIASAVQPLFAKHGVVICPSETTVEVTEITVNNKPWTDTAIHIRWVVAGPGTREIHAMSSGQGRDNSDKGINKATTSAYKNLLLRLLCIGDPEDDTDGQTHEAQYPDPEPEPERHPADVLFERVKVFAGTTVAAELKAESEQCGQPLTANGFRKDPKWFELVDKIVTAAEASPPPAVEEGTEDDNADS